RRGARAGGRPDDHGEAHVSEGGLMAAKTTDTVVIGAGHNGLIAATSLAKARRRVLVLERAERPGGIRRGSQPAPGSRAPGLIHTVGRLRPSVVKDLRLDRFGYST